MTASRQPQVCICIPTNDAGRTIRETLASIVAQSYESLDILIVDNASTDDTLSVVGEFNDERIRVHRNPQNIGAEGNFNRCIELATGKYTAIFHADDIYESGMVAEQVAFLEANPEAGGVLTEAVTIDESGKAVGEIVLPADIRAAGPLFGFDNLFRAVLRHSNFLICPSAMVRTSVYKSTVGRWRGELFGSSADLDVWLRIARQAPLGLLPRKLMRYRVSAAQFSASVRRHTERADFFRVIDHYLAQQEIRAAMSHIDFANYEKLGRRDTVMRAANLFLAGDFPKARNLLNDFFTFDSIAAAMQDRRGLGVLLLGSYVKMLNNPWLRKSGQAPLRHLKRLMRK